MTRRVLPLFLLLLSTSTFAQTTTSTLCQAAELKINDQLTERRLIGCGEGFPDNLLWHLDRADSTSGTLDTKLARRFTGRGVVIYVIDSGVLAQHDEFTRATGSNVIGGIEGESSSTTCTATKPCTGPGIVNLVFGHGTGVASVAAGRNTGVAPDASIVAVMNTNSKTFFLTQLKRIIEHAHAPSTPSFRTAVINISASLSVGDPNAPEVEALIRRMTTGVNAASESDPNGKRFFFSAAAGNAYPGQPQNQCGENDSVILYPASLGPSIDGLVSVGGITRENQYWPGACKGAGVEVAAPAFDMFVASISTNDSYRYKPELGASGTSWSAPYVAGIAAQLLEANPNYTPAELEALLKASPSKVDGIPVPILPEPKYEGKRRSVRR